MPIQILRPARGINTTKEQVIEVMSQFSSRPALSMRTEAGELVEYTYGQLRDHIIELSTYLIEKLGVKKGERVALISESRVEWPVVWYAVTSCGAIVVPVDVFMNANEMIFPLTDSGAKIAFVSATQLEKLEEVKDSLKNIKRIIVLDRVQDLEEKGYLFFYDVLQAGRELIEKGDKKFFKRKVSPDDVASLIYTSGTTGVSKGVMLTHKNIMSDAEAMYQCVPIGPEDRVVSVLPLHHSYECTAGLVTLLHFGASVRYARTLRSDLLLAVMREVRPTVMLVVPLLLEKLASGVWKALRKRGILVYLLFRFFYFLGVLSKKLFGRNIFSFLFSPIRKQMGIDHLRFFISGGGPLAKEVIDDFDIMGVLVLQGYGLTEASPVVSLNTPWQNKPGSVGLPIPGVEAKIRDPDDEGVGELLIRGPIVMKGYYKNPKATKEALRDGWLYTGDLAMIDEEGFIWIKGRLKNIIVTRGGKNVYPEELELLLVQSPYIMEALVIGERDETGTEYPYAIIVPDLEALEEHARTFHITLNDETMRKIIASEIKKHTHHVASYKRIKDFEIRLEELPKTSTKKIKRYLFQKHRF